jgi:Tol biopolymer transport system component
LLYGARRNNNFDLYSIPATGGDEKRLTVSLAYDGNPDCSPDGKFIYFNSDRGGNQDIWRIPATGAGPDDSRAQRITKDESEDWFPHPSPNGNSLIFLSFQKGVLGHPRNQPVELREVRLQDSQLTVRTIKKLVGGQGTINANSWAPDSERFAYVRYVVTGK